MAKSFNLKTPAASFFSVPAPTPAEPQEIQPTAAPAPEGFELRPAIKSKRLNLLVRPAAFDKLSRLADEVNALASRQGCRKKMSVNELFNILADECSLDAAALAAKLVSESKK